MKLLKCKLCGGEVDIVANHRAVAKKIKCRKCNYSNLSYKDKPMPEIVVIKKNSNE